MVFILADDLDGMSKVSALNGGTMQRSDGIVYRDYGHCRGKEYAQPARLGYLSEPPVTLIGSFHRFVDELSVARAATYGIKPFQLLIPNNGIRPSLFDEAMPETFGYCRTCVVGKFRVGG